MIRPYIERCIRTFIFLCTFVAHDSVLLNFIYAQCCYLGLGDSDGFKLVIDVYVRLGSPHYISV